MKTKMVLKGIFVTVLTITLIALAVIAFTKIDKTDALYELNKSVDYRIVDNVDNCSQIYMDCFYKNENGEYCFECKKSSEVLLEWSDGSQTKMLDSLKEGSVSIESLIEHGLKVVTNND